MKRRQFLRNLSLASAVAPIMLNGYSVHAFQDHQMFSPLELADCDERILVLVQLNGGNDGLNTVIPLDQYGLYQSARKNIAVQEQSVLKLTDSTGLHPQMQAFQTMFKDGSLKLIQDVGYPVPNYSHFRSTDIWLTGSDSEEYLTTGWLGRYLDKRFPNYPSAYPNAEMSDPLAIQIGSVLSLGFEGPAANMAMAFTDPTSYYNIVNGSGNQSSTNRSEFELAYIRKIGEQLQKFATPVKNAASKAKNKSTLYPAAKSNPLADQLKIVAQLIAGGLKTKVYMVSLTGFDTHANQLQGGNGTPTPHGTLLQQVSVAIQAFMDDCKLLGIDHRILGMTFSEFGRRIASNASAGTDHGAAGPVFLFGTQILPGIIGHNSIIPQNPGPEDNIPMQTDFRTLYASILKQWFCIAPANLKELTVHDFAYDLPILQNSTSTVQESISVLEETVSIFPNPAIDLITLTANCPTKIQAVSLFDNTGRFVKQLIGTIPPGPYSMTIQLNGLSPGYYIIQFQLPFGQVLSKPLIVS